MRSQFVRRSGIGFAVSVAALMGLGQGRALASTMFGTDVAAGAAAGSTADCSSFTFSAGTGGSCVSVQSATDAGGPAAAPAAGVVTSWAFKSNFASTARLRILHDPAGTASSTAPESVTYAGTSASVTLSADSALHTYPTRLPISSGDLLGLELTGASANKVLYRSASGSGTARRIHIYAGAADGTVGPSEANLDLPTSVGVITPLRATIEADVDGDGYGDETQDLCPTDASTQGACPLHPAPDTSAPETTISKGPGKKTASTRATFTFSSSEAGSTFECSLDGSPFAACSSPDKVKVKRKGKHNFQVRARDAAGNVDSSEATYSWSVKKKKKHHGHG